MVLRGGASAAAATALDAAQAALARESQRLHQPRPRVCAQLVQIVELEQLEAEPIVADPQPVVESASCR